MTISVGAWAPLGLPPAAPLGALGAGAPAAAPDPPLGAAPPGAVGARQAAMIRARTTVSQTNRVAVECRMAILLTVASHYRRVTLPIPPNLAGRKGLDNCRGAADSLRDAQG